MSRAEDVIIKCGNASCSAKLLVPGSTAEQGVPATLRFIASRSWTFKRVAGEDRPVPLCGRCAGDT